MKNKKSKNIFYILLLLIGIIMISFGFTGDDRNGNKPYHPVYKQSAVQESGKQGDAYALNVNNIYLPMNRKGIIADVNIPPLGSGGQFGGNVFLFSSGFFLSGFANGQMWANAVASASLTEDYQPGTVAGGQGDPNAVMYVLNSQDEDFGPSWQDWIDAVGLGADFYDGDGDGAYTPVDKNGNGEWDPDEDRPDIIGDETVWCVYSDGIPAAQRNWNTVPPYGIEIRQMVFAFASAGAIGNLIFVRYRFKYVGLGNAGEADVMENVYFGVWADVDLGDPDDDVVGSDVPRNAGYTYQNVPDDLYGNQPPCYMIDFFSGPVAFILGETYIDDDGSGDYTPGVDTPLDTAFSVRGQVMGVVEIPGAKNLPTSSFVLYINGDPNLNDPGNKEEARNYITGLDRNGIAPDPCIFPFGEVRGGVDCTTVDPKFWFSGDPVTDVGWIATINEDVRQMTNTGPFELVKGEENEIVVAYVVGQGTNPLNSITVARQIDDGAQNIFDLNFLAPSPPSPTIPTITASDDFIEIFWDTDEQVGYLNNTPTWDLKFHSFKVYAFQTNTTVDIVDNRQNSKLIATYQVENFIDNVFKESAETGGKDLLYPESPDLNKLDLDIYTDPELGRLRLRVFNDPFSPSNPVTKGTPYYFAIVGTAINYDALVYKDDETQPVGTAGDYFLTSESFVQEVENIRQITSIVVGEQLYSPPVAEGQSNKISGASEGELIYDPVTKSELTGDQYEVTFFADSSTELYSTFWKLENITNNTVLLDSSKEYTFGSDLIGIEETEGFIVRISDVVAAADTDLTYEFGEMWVDSLNSVFHYLSTDINESSKLQNIGGNLSNLTGSYVTADRLRRVEIRFGETQKAYRYLNGFFGANNTQQKRFFKYAEAVTSADTIGKGPVGMWDAANDRPFGYVDVPFQVWVEDPNWDEMKQMTIGFIEKRADLGGNPDGIWDPGTTILLSGEYIFIFDETYDPDGNQRLYKGGPNLDPNAGYADLNGAGIVNGVFYPIPDEANLTQDERNIVESSFFNTLYAVGIQKATAESTFMPGDKVVINVDTYPYTTADVYQFQTSEGGALTDNDEQELFNKVNVFPNPLYGFNTLTGYDGTAPDEPWVTFTNLPTDITVRIYSLSGQLLRILTTADKSEPDSPFLRWDLQNENGLRAASGLYMALVSSPKFGDKVLKFTIIMPQKQIPRF
jgi:hypothetical protein